MGDPISSRRFRFALRTLFVLLAFVAVGTWVANSLLWIRARHEAERQGTVAHMFRSWCGNAEPPPYGDAPGGLWIFGERGLPEISIYVADPQERERLRRLFPEAEFVDYPVMWQKETDSEAEVEQDLELQQADGGYWRIWGNAVW